MTARQKDLNGWYEVRRNPLTKVGVFPYLGRQIDPKGAHGMDPDKVYQVLRPPEELSDPETLNSLRLIPIIEDHTMLGEGAAPVETKTIGGVTGDQIEYDPRDRTVYGNIKIFGGKLAKTIDGGKRDLSLGYRCAYDFTPGTFEGKHYDAVQRRPRGNHNAVVKRGRMGSDVAVLDNLTFAADAEDWEPMDKLQLLLTAASAALAAGRAGNLSSDVLATLDSAIVAAKDDDGMTGDAKVKEAEAKAADAMKAKEAAEKEAADAKATCDAALAENARLKAATAGDSGDVTALTAALDAANGEITALKARPVVDVKTVMGEISRRDTLAKRLAPHIGAFDHSAMPLSEVASYGVEKLKLQNVAAGHELTALDAYLSAAPTPKAVAKGGEALDTAVAGGAVSNWLTGASK